MNPHPHPQLKLIEEEHLTKAKDVAVLVEELAQINQTIKTLEATMPPNHMRDMDLFNRYCPEAKQLLEDPDVISESPEEINSGYAFRLAPLTNRQKHYQLYVQWINSSTGYESTPEGKLYLSSQKRLQNLTNKARLISNQIDWGHWVAAVIATKPLPLAARGLEFINRIIAPPAPEKSRSRSRTGPTVRRHSGTQHQIYSLLLPIAFSEYPSVAKPEKEKDLVRFHLSRDESRGFSADGNTLVITLSEAVYGVIYAQSNEIWMRIPDPRNKWKQIENQSFSNLLTAAIVGIFEEIGANPEQYFAATGRKHGMCMMCGRDLSDADSIARGFGKICGGLFT